MIYPISIKNEPGELVLIEIQGELEGIEGTPMEIGSIAKGHGDSYILEINNKQRLIGKKVRLSKPLAVMRRHQVAKPIESEDEHPEHKQKRSRLVEISAKLVTEKIIFNNRPVLIIQ